MSAEQAGCRLTRILAHLSISPSNWYRDRKELPSKPGRPLSPIAEDVIDIVLGMSWSHPWYGFRRIAVMCRRCGFDVKRWQAYEIMKTYDLLQSSRKPKGAIYQAAKLYSLLPQGPNELWQTDVTYLHIPGHGWWYAVTVIDYYSRYLLAIDFTPSCRAVDCIRALEMAYAEASNLCGPIANKINLVTDNGVSFVAKAFQEHVKIGDKFEHVRIQYRTPQQLGLLERFHGTLKKEEVYWNLYESPSQARECLAAFRERYNWDRPHWALEPLDVGEPRVPAEVYAKGEKIKIPRWQKWAAAALKKIESEIPIKLTTHEVADAA